MSRFQNFFSALNLFESARTETVVDLGSAVIKYSVAKTNKGSMPSCIAVMTDSREFLSIGYSALSMKGKNSSKASIVFPFKVGKVVHEAEAKLLVENLISFFGLSRILRNRGSIVLSVVDDLSKLQKDLYRKLFSSYFLSGVKFESQIDRLILHSSLAKNHAPTIVLIYGASCTQVFITKSGRVLYKDLVTQGTQKFSQEVCQVVRTKFQLLISEQEADSLRYLKENEMIKTVRGQDLIQQRPDSKLLKQEDILFFRAQEVAFLSKLIEKAAEKAYEFNDLKTPLQVFLTGGGSLRAGLAEQLAAATGLKTKRSANSLYDTTT